MIKGKQVKTKKFKWNWLAPARNAFFILYVFCLIAVAGGVFRQFSKLAVNPVKEALEETFGSFAYKPINDGFEVDHEKIHGWISEGDQKLTIFKFSVSYLNDRYTFLAALNREKRVATIKQIKGPELMPKMLFQDEDLFFLSLEGRKSDDLPDATSTNDFKGRFLNKLKKIMMEHSKRVNIPVEMEAVNEAV